ncbi:hypothetical protein [Microtetraspora fusca]|uniref:hypothetical protein n=1 Tax=Microtetraspora fusca TaxID=1997 RepID=UPI000A017AC8|nr:hypothetical protein [Microtetraspora fusca]
MTEYGTALAEHPAIRDPPQQSDAKALLTEYHGLHVAPTQKQHDKIRWIAPTSRSSRIRVREHTCECKATIYELCQAGGLTFIRRTVRGPDGPVVHEGPWLLAAKAQRLWHHLLLGQAR